MVFVQNARNCLVIKANNTFGYTTENKLYKSYLIFL